MKSWVPVSPATYKVVKVLLPIVQARRRWRQEDRKFRIIINYIVNNRLA